VVLSGLSSIGAASQRSRIRWTSITENREIKKRPSSPRRRKLTRRERILSGSAAWSDSFTENGAERGRLA
jgi:hypothetical protein